MSRHPLLDVAVKAAGGLERWHRVREIQATVSSGGLAFLGRLRGAKRHLKIGASPMELALLSDGFGARLARLSAAERTVLQRLLEKLA